MKKTVCIIGGGASGITMTKQLFDEGHTPVCYEKSPDMGGVFYYQKGSESPENKKLVNGVYENTVLTISNYLMSFSDMPPKGHRRHWHHTEYQAYLRDYVAKFDLKRAIHLQQEVTRVVPIDRGRGGYTVYVKGPDGVTRIESYDAIAVCTGTHQMPSIPKIAGLDQFKGKIIHSSQYDNNELARGKRVLCVGLGESSADITREISDAASECYLGLRSYPFLIPRNLDHSSSDAWTSRLHHDYHTPKHEGFLAYLFLSLYYFLFKNLIFCKNTPQKDSFLQDCNERMLDLRTPGQAEYVKLIKCWNYLSKGRKFATKNVTFVPNIVNGKIKVNASGIARFTERGVEFNDGEKRDIDMVMFATGYREDFSMIEGFTLKDNNVRNMFMNSIHPDLHNCAFIGWARPVTGGIPACSEAAARYYALLLSGHVELPSDIRSRIETDKQFYEQFYAKHSPELNTVVAWKRHLENYSELIGCQVKPLRYLLQPRLFARLFAGSLVPAQYRLRGPHAAPETAKKAILSLPITLPREHILYGIKMNMKNKVAYLRKKALQRKIDLEYSQFFSEWFRFDVKITADDVKRFTFRRDNFSDNFKQID